MESLDHSNSQQNGTSKNGFLGKKKNETKDKSVHTKDIHDRYTLWSYFLVVKIISSCNFQSNLIFGFITK